MIDGPHIFGFSPDALRINLTSALASARLVGSVSVPINAATLNLLGLVLFSAILPCLPASFQGYTNMLARLVFRGAHLLPENPSRDRGDDEADRKDLHERQRRH